MFEEQFDRLTDSEKDGFRRILNRLLAHTFIVESIHDFRTDVKRSNPDYLFITGHFSLFEDYLSFAGFRLERVSDLGVIRIWSETCDDTRVHFNMLTTDMIYVLRSIYDERRKELYLSDDVYVSVGELVNGMMEMGLIQKKPANSALVSSLNALLRYRIVEKVSGKINDAETRLLILPTILFVISDERLADVTDLIDGGAEDDDTEYEDEVEEDTEYEETEETSADTLV